MILNIIRFSSFFFIGSVFEKGDFIALQVQQVASDLADMDETKYDVTSSEAMDPCWSWFHSIRKFRPEDPQPGLRHKFPRSKR